MGVLGEHLLEELIEEGIYPLCIIDERSYTVNSDVNIPIMQLNDNIPFVDIIIVTPIEYFTDINNKLLNILVDKTKIASLEDVIYSL